MTRAGYGVLETDRQHSGLGSSGPGRAGTGYRSDLEVYETYTAALSSGDLLIAVVGVMRMINAVFTTHSC